MLSKLQTLTWNIGGAKILEPGANPYHTSSYNQDGIESIAQYLQQSNADFVALQEVERKGDYDQAEIIARQAGYNYYVHDSVSPSHITKEHWLGNAILSRYPITHHEAGIFPNPNIAIEWEDGSKSPCHDKGYSKCKIMIGKTAITAISLHLLPLSLFNIVPDSAQGQAIFRGVSDSLAVDSTNPLLIMGDFNIDGRVVKYLPKLFNHHKLQEALANEPTTPDGKTLDHILYSNMTLTSKQTNPNVLTDHYPFACEFTTLQ